VFYNPSDVAHNTNLDHALVVWVVLVIVKNYNRLVRDRNPNKSKLWDGIFSPFVCQWRNVDQCLISDFRDVRKTHGFAGGIIAVLYTEFLIVLWSAIDVMFLSAFALFLKWVILK
jgi:hypothetical protein